MDDDTAIGPDTAEQIARFINANPAGQRRNKLLAQGVLTYPRQFSSNGVAWLADAVRAPTCPSSGSGPAVGDRCWGPTASCFSCAPTSSRASVGTTGARCPSRRTPTSPSLRHPAPRAFGVAGRPVLRQLPGPCGSGQAAETMGARSAPRGGQPRRATAQPPPAEVRLGVLGARAVAARVRRPGGVCPARPALHRARPTMDSRPVGAQPRRRSLDVRGGAEGQCALRGAPAAALLVRARAHPFFTLVEGYAGLRGFIAFVKDRLGWGSPSCSRSSPRRTRSPLAKEALMRRNPLRGIAFAAVPAVVALSACSPFASPVIEPSPSEASESTGSAGGGSPPVARAR